MNTALISFEGGLDYLKEKQIRSILREEKEPWGISCKDYDELDALIPILKEHQIKNLVILHEDRNLDRFEIAFKQEYGNLFEKIEILPEGFIRLKEAIPSGQAQQAGAAQNAIRGSSVGATGQRLQQIQNGEQQANFKTISIYGPNPLLAGTQDLGIKDTDDNLIISLLSLQCAKTGLWNFSAPVNAVIKKFPAIKNFATGRTIEGVLRLFNIQPQAAPNIIVYAGQVPTQALTNDATLAGKITQFQGKADTQKAVAAYKIGTEIIQGKAKPDSKKCEEWETNRLPLLGFLIKQLGDIQHSMTVGEQDESNKDGHSLVNNVLETFSVYKDLATAAKNIRTGGGALLLDAAKVISKELSQKKERKEKKSDTLVSHPKFEEFANFFCDDLENSSKEFIEV
jgi:hypothetical protein